MDSSKLQYRSPHDDDQGEPPNESPAATLALAFAPLSLTMDLILYAIADASRTEGSVGAAAIVVVGLGVMGAALGIIGAQHRGHRRIAAVLAVPLNLAIATWFVLMLASLA